MAFWAKDYRDAISQIEALVRDGETSMIVDQLSDEMIVGLAQDYNEGRENMCPKCTQFFREYKGACYSGECDCPKCQGYCTCATMKEFRDAMPSLKKIIIP